MGRMKGERAVMWEKEESRKDRMDVEGGFRIWLTGEADVGKGKGWERTRGGEEKEG